MAAFTSSRDSVFTPLMSFIAIPATPQMSDSADRRSGAPFFMAAVMAMVKPNDRLDVVIVDHHQAKKETSLTADDVLFFDEGTLKLATEQSNKCAQAEASKASISLESAFVEALQFHTSSPLHRVVRMGEVNEVTKPLCDSVGQHQIVSFKKIDTKISNQSSSKAEKNYINAATDIHELIHLTPAGSMLVLSLVDGALPAIFSYPKDDGKDIKRKAMSKSMHPIESVIDAPQLEGREEWQGVNASSLLWSHKENDEVLKEKSPSVNWRKYTEDSLFCKPSSPYHVFASKSVESESSLR